ncbi:MAG: SemiSWEET family transporter [Candidatus Paceibacterota bacterium]
MYNPQNLHECEKEKKRLSSFARTVGQASNHRKIIDGIMMGIGGIASVSSIPQVIKIWETQTVVGISMTTQLLALFAVVSWFFYGLYIKNKPLALTSGLTALIVGTVVVQMFIYG